MAPQFLATKQPRGVWPSLDLVFDAGSFNAENAATRWGAFFASGSRYARALQSKWGRLQRAGNSNIMAAGPATPPT